MFAEADVRFCGFTERHWSAGTVAGTPGTGPVADAGPRAGWTGGGNAPGGGLA